MACKHDNARKRLSPSSSSTVSEEGTLWKIVSFALWRGTLPLSSPTRLSFGNVVKRHADFLSALGPAEIREYQSMGIASFSVWNSTMPWRTKMAT